MNNQRGVALIMSLMVLLLLTVLVIALLSLVPPEVVISANLLSTIQARALAESGLEWALAQLNTPAGTPWVIDQSLDVNGISVGRFSTFPSWISPTEVSVYSAGVTAGPRPASSACRVTLIQNPLDLRWNQKPGTWRQS